MAKSKARFLADVLQDDGSSIFVGNFAVPADFVIDPAGSPTGLGNASLQNSSITINSYDTSLGSSVTLVTDDINEGGSPTNLYFTNARAQAAFTGGTGVTLTGGSISIGQSVETTDNVTFNQVTATVPYDNSVSGLTATNVQSAITELNTLLGGGNVGSQATYNVYEYTTAGNDTQFDLSALSPAGSYIPGYVQVYLNGLLLSESDYTAVDGSTINFSPAITNAGQLLYIIAYDSFNTAEILRVTSIDASASTNSISIDANDDVSLLGSLSFADNEKAVFGADSDLQIYHDGSGSFISDQGPGTLNILTSGFNVINPGNTETLIDAVENGAVQLYYDNAPKLATTATGIDVTGTVTADGLTVKNDSASILIENDASTRSQRFRRNASNSLILDKYNGTTTTNTAKFDENGDITFYDTDGTTASFFYDASAGLTINEAGADRDFRVESVNNENMLFIDASADRIGIGTNTPKDSIDLSLNKNISFTDTAQSHLRFNANADDEFTTGVSNFRAGRYIFNVGNGYHAIQTSSNTGAAGAAISGWTNLWTGYAGINIFNDDAADLDFRVESVNNENMLFVDAGNNSVNINSSAANGAFALKVVGTATSGARTGWFGGPDVNLATSTSAPVLTLENTSATTGNMVLLGFQNSSTNAIGSLGYKNEDTANAYGTFYLASRGATNGWANKLAVYDTEATWNEDSLNYDFRVESNNNANMLFVDAGNDRVGIGRAPTISNSKLEVGGADDVSLINVEASGNTGGIGIGSSGLQFFHGSSAKMRIDSDGHVGINESAPDAYLHVSGLAANSAAAGVIFEGAWPWLKFKDTESGQDTYSFYNDNALYLTRLSFANSGNAPNGGTNIFNVGTSETVFNNDSIDQDFRVESGSNASMLFVDAGNNTVSIGTSSDPTAGTFSAPNLYIKGKATGIFTLVHLEPSSDTSVLGIGYDGTNNEFVVNSSYRSTGGFRDLVFQYRATTDDIFRIPIGSGTEMVFNDSSKDLDFRVESDSNTHMLHVDAGNNGVGIGGVGSSGQELTVYGTMRAEGSGSSIIVDAGSGGYFTRMSQAYNFPYSDGFIEGVAASSYHSRLTFKNNTNAGTAVENLRMSQIEGAVFNEGGVDMDFRVESDSDAHALFVDASADAVAMGISGQLTTGGFDPKLTVDAAGGTGNTCFFRNNLGNAVVGVQLGGSAGAQNAIVFYNQAGTSCGTIQSPNGNAGTTISYNTSSDARLKENIADAEDAGAKVDAIQVRQFDWKESGYHQPYGMIAQELNNVAPEACSIPDDPDEIAGVDYSKLVPMLIKEIQSLRARVHALEGK